MTSIDSLVKSETYKIKETVHCSSYEKFRKILKRHFAEPFKRALFRATTKTYVLAEAHILVVLSFHPFVTNGNNIVNFHSTHLIGIWLLQNSIPATVDLIDHF